jgi:hypothetical protein
MENKRLLKEEELKGELAATVVEPYLYKILKDINKDNIPLNLIDFNALSREYLFTPIELTYEGQKHLIQANFCADPFCKWYGLGKTNLQQEHVTKMKNNIKLSGDFNNKYTNCNNDPEDFDRGVVTSSTTTTLSNYSLALEIKRLLDIRTLISVNNDDNAIFHKPDCRYKFINPFANRKFFERKAINQRSKSIKWMCKECGKTKYVKPELEENFTIGLQNSEKIIPLFRLLMNGNSIRAACNILEISADTIYSYIELIYTRCLMFLEKHETNILSDMNLGDVYLSTDQLIFNNNNFCDKYKGFDTEVKERTHIQTRIISTVENRSYYVFATDIAYDFNTSATDVFNDYKKYNEELLTYYVQKNERLNLGSYVLDKVNKNRQKKELVNYFV